MARRAAGMDKGLKGIALFEATKGLLVIVVGLGLIALLHRDAQAIAELIVSRYHLNPASRYPTIFLSLAAHPDDPRLWAIGASALVYAGMRLTEAYGLWHQRAWASWLGVWSGAIYIPVELYEAIAHPTLIHIGLAIANAAIVAYLATSLARRRAASRQSAAPQGENRTKSAPSPDETQPKSSHPSHSNP